MALFPGGALGTKAKYRSRECFTTFVRAPATVKQR